MNYPECVTARTYNPYATIQGLLSQIQIVETRKAHPRDPGSRGARLAPRAFNIGVVDSLGRGFVWINPLDITTVLAESQ